MEQQLRRGCLRVSGMWTFSQANKFYYFLLPKIRSASHFLSVPGQSPANVPKGCPLTIPAGPGPSRFYWKRSTCLQIQRNSKFKIGGAFKKHQESLICGLLLQSYMLHNRFRLITRPAVVVLDRPAPEDSDIDDQEAPGLAHCHRDHKRDSHSLLACVSLRGRRQPSHQATLKTEAVMISSSGQDSQSGSESLVFVRKATSAECLKRKLRRQATVCNKVKLQRRDENTPECSICLTALKELSEKEIGRLNCGHTFCFSCILQSSKFSNRCPYCRAAFSTIRHGKRTTTVPDARLNEGFDDPMDEPCYICGRNDDFQRLLECEYCEYAYCHTYCDVRLNSDRPPLGNWYCLSCVELLNNQLDPHSVAQEIFEDSS